MSAPSQGAGASQLVLVVKILPANAGYIRDAGSTPGLGRCPGGGHSHPLQYSCLENPLDRGAWRATVHRFAKSWTRLKQLSTQSSAILGMSLRRGGESRRAERSPLPKPQHPAQGQGHTAYPVDMPTPTSGSSQPAYRFTRNKKWLCFKATILQ